MEKNYICKQIYKSFWSMKRIIIALLAVVAAINVSAQELRWGVVGGLNFAWERAKTAGVKTVVTVSPAEYILLSENKPEDMELAHRYNDLHNAGRDDLIPFTEMELTTVVAEAGRMVRLEHGPEEFPMLMSAIAIGNVAMFGIPGEPFTGIGRGLKEAEGWDLVLPCCLTNGDAGYFPMMDAYDEGGYEARSSSFKAGVAELIIEEGKKLMNELKE